MRDDEHRNDECRNDACRTAGQNIRLIVCDLDGTLLDSAKQISPANRAAIQAAQERGIFVTICSGRVHTMLEAYSRALAIRGPLIAANGAVIYDTRAEKIVQGAYLDARTVEPLLRFCAERDFDHLVLSSEACWYAKDDGRVERFVQYNRIAAADGLPELPIRRFGPAYRTALSGAIYKVLIAGLNPAEQRETEAYIAALGNLSCTSSDADLLDVSASGVDKGTGLLALARILGFRRQEIGVFGDYRNDIPMLKAAGRSFAMGNADETVKQHASDVTLSNDEDGVAYAIERYILGYGV